MMTFCTENGTLKTAAEAPRVALALRSFGPKGRN
jgi:hypothetical protein